METARKPARVATETRLDVRVTLDPHMGAIYSRLLAVPGRLRGRELLALARLAVVNAEGSPAVRVPAGTAASAPGSALSLVVGDEPRTTDLGAGLEHLGGFADATPPMH